MKIIKNYASSTQERHGRLLSYRSQARSYRERSPSTNSFSFVKGTLAAIIPLAAAGAVQAQCLPAIGSVYVQGLVQNVSFDVDGDSVGDFNLKHLWSDPGSYPPLSFTTLYLVPKPNFYVKAIGNVAVRFSGVVTRDQANFKNGRLELDYWYNLFGNIRTGGDFQVQDGQGYLAIRKGDNVTGRPGWVSFQTLSVNPNGSNVNIGERFLATPGNNIAITGNCSPPLPVEMTYFKVDAQDNSMLLEWETATEINSAGFEIQRSNDGMTFSKIGWVDGQGNSTERHTYQFEDKNLQANTNYYYRLKQMDSDGTSEYSPIRTAMVKDAKRLNVGELFPNPTSREYGFAMFKLNVPEAGEMMVEVFDMRGSKMKSFTRNFAAGDSTLDVPVADLPPGQYVVKMQLGAAMEYRKLMVE